MKHIKTLSGRTLQSTLAGGGCGECKNSCQSACKTSVTVANQVCLGAAADSYKRGEKAPRARGVN